MFKRENEPFCDINVRLDLVWQVQNTTFAGEFEFVVNIVMSEHCGERSVVFHAKIIANVY